MQASVTYQTACVGMDNNKCTISSQPYIVTMLYLIS